MNRQVVSALAIALAALSAGQAMAQEAAPKTREQVRAELREAIRNGDIVADSMTGRTYRDLFPARYDAKAKARVEESAPSVQPQGKTRADVKAELTDAIRQGDTVADSMTGRTYRDLFPSRYPAASAN